MLPPENSHPLGPNSHNPGQKVGLPGRKAVFLPWEVMIRKPNPYNCPRTSGASSRNRRSFQIFQRGTPG